MKPKDILLQWVDAFNRADVESITKLYAETACVNMNQTEG